MGYLNTKPLLRAAAAGLALWGGPAFGDYFDDLKASRQESSALVPWTPLGPGMSGYIDKFWIHDTDPNVMFMDLDMGNTHGTWNHGDKWSSIRDNDGTGNALDSPTWVEFSHQEPDFGLLIAKDGLYSTEDRGRTWQFLLDIEPANSEKHNVLTVDPSDDRNWYIGAGQGWMIKFTHYNQDGIVYSADRNHSEGFILKSSDRGQSWTKVRSIFPADADFSRIIVDPRDSSKVYASCQYGVYRSADAGASWAKVPGSGLPRNTPRDMASFYDASSDEFLLYIVEITRYAPSGSTIATTGGVYRSADGGDHWDDLTGNLGIDLNQINSWGYQDKYWTAIAYWLKISKAEAKSRYPDLPTSTFSQFITIDVDPFDRDRIYLHHNFKHDYSFPPGNIWMTENGGANWIAAAREGVYWSTEKDKAYWQSRGNPLGINTTFAHVEREHQESDNTQTGPRFLAVNSIGEVYTAFAQQVMRSTDKGASWVQVDDFETAPGSGHWVGRGDSNLPGESLCVETGRPGVYLFGSGEHGLWRNADDGHLVYPGANAVEQVTGQSIDDNSPLSIASIAVHPSDPNKLYTLQFRQTRRGDLRYSPDNGATWQTLSTPINFPEQNDVIKQHSLLIDPATPSNMYFCVPRSELTYFASTNWSRNGPDGFNAYGVYRSTDDGSSWSLANSGIPSGKSVYRLEIDPAHPKTLYAALNQKEDNTSGGLYRSTNGASSWSPVILPAGVESVNQIKIRKSDGALFIACGTYSSDGSTGGAFVSSDSGASWTRIFDMPNVRGVAPSNVDPQVIAVNVGQGRSVNSLNPGLYATLDGGATWTKINRNIGQPDRINELEADPYDADILWCALAGTGFWKADLSTLRAGGVFGKWMSDYGLSDPEADADRDGASNRSEYYWGTHPMKGSSLFRPKVSPMLDGGRVSIVFASSADRLYDLMVSSSPSGPWIPLKSGLSGESPFIEIMDAEIEGSRFYRIQARVK